MKLLITVPWNEEQMRQVKGAFPQVEFATALTREQALQEMGDAEVVFGNVSREVFLAAKNLRWIQCHSAGVDSLIAIGELVESDVQLTNTSGAHAATISEHFFGMLIALARRLPQLYEAQRRREWVDWSEWPEKVGARPVGLLGMTLGVIGLGNIGHAIAARARAFEMRVVAVDVRYIPRPDFVSQLWPADNLSELLTCSDAVVVTVPGTPQTLGMLDRQALALMKPTAYLSVVSRGGVVDEEALAAMLKEGRLAGAALDVAAAEPLPDDSPLWDAPNLILTPHCAGKSETTTAFATAIFQENLRRYLAGEPLINPVDKRLGF